MSHPDEDVDGNKGAQFFFVKYDQVRGKVEASDEAYRRLFTLFLTT